MTVLKPNLPVLEFEVDDAPEKPESAIDREVPDLMFLHEARRLSRLTLASTDSLSTAIAYLHRRYSRPPKRDEPPAPRMAEPSPTPEIAPRYDVNTASVKELSLVTGMDERRARAIVTFRTLHRPFRHLDELSHVFGVTDNQVDGWREMLYVATPAPVSGDRSGGP